MPRSFMPEVTLPTGFQVDKEVKDNAVHFKFSSPIELSFDKSTFEELVRRERQLQKKRGSREEARAQYDTVPMLHAHAEMVLGTALPEFVNPDFYALEEHLHESNVHFMSRLRAIPRGLHVWIGDFEPYKALREGKRPVIVEGNIKGTVYLPTRIWRRDTPSGPRVYSGTYDSHTSSSIVTALLYQEPLAMGSQRFTGSYINDHLAVTIANPTIERMQAVQKEGEQIEDYMNQHLDELSSVGEIFEAARRMHDKELLGVLGSYEQLKKAVQEARTRLGDKKIPFTATIDDTAARIQTHVDRKLSEAADILAPLAEHFPRGLLQYIASNPSP